MNAMMQMRSFGHRMHVMGACAVHSERLHKIEKLLASEHFWVILAVTMLSIGIVWMMLWLSLQSSGFEAEPFKSVFYGPHGLPYGYPLIP